MQPEDILLVLPATNPVQQMSLDNPLDTWRDPSGYKVVLTTGHILTVTPGNAQGMADVDTYLRDRFTYIQPTAEDIDYFLSKAEEPYTLKTYQVAREQAVARLKGLRASYEAECRIKLSIAQQKLREEHGEAVNG